MDFEVLAAKGDLVLLLPVLFVVYAFVSSSVSKKKRTFIFNPLWYVIIKYPHSCFVYAYLHRYTIVPITFVIPVCHTYQ